MSFSSVITNVVRQIGYDISDLRVHVATLLSSMANVVSTSNSNKDRLDAVEDTQEVLSFKSYARLFASGMTYGSGSKKVSNGDYVLAAKENLLYEVVSAVDTRGDIVTNGGVHLAYIPSDNRYDVRAFGAVGDGNTNDTVAVQKAVNRAQAQSTYATPTQSSKNNHNGATVYFPRGRYTCTAIIISESGVHIMGESMANTMIQQPNGGKLFVIRHIDEDGGGVLMNIAVSDLDLRGTSLNPTVASVALEVGIVKHTYFYNLKINGFNVDMWLYGVQAPCFINNCNFFSGSSVTGNTGDGGGVHIRLDAATLSGTSPNKTYAALTDPDNGGVGYAHSILVFVSGCEFRNGADAKRTTFDIRSVDGLYVDNCHMINPNDEFIKIDQKASITPCANIKFSDCMFDGEAFGTERVLNIPDKNWAGGNKTDVDAVFYNCKFNGCGGVGETSATHVTCYSPYVKGLTFDGCYFDKCTGNSWVAIYGGGGVLSIKNCRFYADTGYSPTAFITLYNPAGQGEFFDFVNITGNVFTGTGALAGASRHINIGGPVKRVALIGNTGNKCAEGDGMVRDAKTAGQVIGAWNTHGNAFF